MLDQISAFDLRFEVLNAITAPNEHASGPPFAPLAKLGIQGALAAYMSFGGILLATRLDKVGEAAVLRETSVVFSALIGWFMLGETTGPRRIALITLIAIGAVIVEMGG